MFLGTIKESNLVGQNFSRTKLIVGHNFSHLAKI